MLHKPLLNTVHCIFLQLPSDVSDVEIIKVPVSVALSCCGQSRPSSLKLSFFLSGVASLWRAHFSDLDYSWAAASSGLLILDEFLNGHSAQVRNQVLDSTKCNSQCMSCFRVA